MSRVVVQVLVPSQQVGVLAETLREVLFRKPVVYRRVGQVRLADEAGPRIEKSLFFPVDRDLGFRQSAFFLRRGRVFRFCHAGEAPLTAARGRPGYNELLCGGAD